MKLKIWLFSALVIGLFSCQSVPKDIIYLQDVDSYFQSQEHLAKKIVYEPIIKQNDQLLITVSSPIPDQTQVAQFNMPMNTAMAAGDARVSTSLSIQTYIVDINGDINFPVIGKISVARLSQSAAIQVLTEKIAAYLPEPIINLQIVEYGVTVLGEVLQPGRIEAINNRITIFEALGAAKDLTIYGDRRNVLLIRENNGEKELYRLDLTQASIINSPCYYLQQNDIIYVEPNKTRQRESTFGKRESFNINILSISLTAVSVLITLMSLIYKK